MKDIIYTRKYTDNNGTEKKEYIRVGFMFEKEDKISILMKPYINLGALQNEKGEVWLNVYDHKTQGKQDKSNLYKGKNTVDAFTEALLRSKDPAQEVKEEISDDTPF